MKKKKLSLRDIEIKQKSYSAYCEYEEKEREIATAKKEMKVIRVSSQDEKDIGRLSSGWDKYLESLKTNMRRARGAGYTKADKVAEFFNQTGFKTGSGEKWTPRLINIAKEIIGIQHGSNVIFPKK